MSTVVASAPHLLARARERLVAPGPGALALGLLALVALSVWLRTRAIGVGYWIDEGLSVGISGHALVDVPAVLERDGSPPLYYLLLHGWMLAFGSGEAQTAALSLLFAVAAVPVAWWAGRALFGPRTAWVAAALAALNPFLTYYAQETRMYALQGLLSLVAVACFLRLFAVRDRRFLWPFAAALTLMLYTHNWAFFLAGGTVAALGVLWRTAADRRALVRDAGLAYGAVALAFLPWLPTFVSQALHTGAPWADRPSLSRLTAEIQHTMGGEAASIALLLVAGAGLWALARREPPAGSDADAHPLPVARIVVALVALTVAAGVLAWLASQVSPAWAGRYFASFLGPLLLLAAAGLTHAGRLGLVCLAIVAVLWYDPQTGAIERKDNTRSVVSSVQLYVQPGDLVLSPHPERIASLRHYLGESPRYATALGATDDPRVFDWRDALPRLRETYPTPTLERLLADMRPGQDVVAFFPIIRTARWSAPWTELVRRRSGQWQERLDGHPRLRRVLSAPIFGYDPLQRGVRAVVYRVVR